jgi:predicted nucleotidyltransferase component of viral defense system
LVIGNSLDNPYKVAYDLAPMIGFGELRKLSLQWGVDITAVERVYVIDWILAGIFDHAMLAQALVLRGGAALRYAYCAEFSLADDPEFLLTQPMDDNAMRDALTESLNASANASGLKFSLAAFERGGGKIEYTGPLGRRSAAQPRVTLAVRNGKTRLEPSRVPLLHLFSDACATTLTAIALEEFAGEHIAALARTPRARDVFDLWFVLTKMSERVDAARARDIAQKIVQEKNVALPRAEAVFAPAHRAVLERAWDNALREARARPSLAQVEKELADALKFIFAE